MKNLLMILTILLIEITASTPYVIVVSFDGFRWDYVNRDTTPNLQSVIDTGVHAISLRPAFPSKTFPNHISIMTGMYTENHGIISNNFRLPDEGEWYNMGNPESKNVSKWYLGEMFWETAKKNNIKTGSYFWPASTLDDETRRPTYFKYYNEQKPYFERVDTALHWLQYPKDKRPYFISLYFHDTDTFGHEYGPNSDEINESIKRCDDIAGYLINGLEKIGLKDSVNLVFVSDHGMTEISKERVINIEQMLEGLEYHHSDNGPFMLIHPSEKDRDQIRNVLEANQNNYKFYLRENVPSHYHYSNSERIPDFVLIADLGYYLANEKDIINWGEYSNAATHGYDNNAMDMHGLFIASGPAFKKNYKTGTVWNVDIYPLLSKIYGLEIDHKVDGSLERIIHILR